MKINNFINICFIILLIILNDGNMVYSGDLPEDIEGIINYSNKIFEQASLDEEKKNNIKNLALKAGLSSIDKIELTVPSRGRMDIVYKVFGNEIYEGENCIIQKVLKVAYKDLPFSEWGYANGKFIENNGFYTNGKLDIIKKCKVSRLDFSSTIINNSDLDCKTIERMFFALKDGMVEIPTEFETKYHELDFSNDLSLSMERDGTFKLYFKVGRERYNVLVFYKDNNIFIVKSIGLILF